MDSDREFDTSTEDVLYPLPSVAEAGVEDEAQSTDEHDELYNIFSSLIATGSEVEVVTGRALIFSLKACGLGADDPRLAGMVDALEEEGGPGALLDFTSFTHVVSPCVELVRRALTGNLVIPDFERFCRRLTAIYEDVRANVHGGRNASYIPQLSKMDPTRFAVSVCTTDGQRFSIGDAGGKFCVQSCAKPIAYTMALQDYGMQRVHYHVGREPSGGSFNKLTMLKRPRQRTRRDSMGRRINPAVTLRPDRPSSVTSKRATVDVPATMGSGASCGELVGREEEVVADGEGFGLAARWRDGSASHSGISGDGGRSERRPGGETGSTSMHPADRRRSGNRSPLATHPGMSGAAPPSREAMQAAIEVDGDEGDWEEGGMIPHNPLINAGAIVVASMLRPDAALSDRMDYVLQTWNRLCNRAVSVNSAVFLSERATADRNFCLAHWMKELGVFPEGTDIHAACELYFSMCSIALTCPDIALLAGTYARGGENPLTGDRVFDPQAVQHTLSVMMSCGLYDASGTFQFNAGIPAKSGIGGCIFGVLPGVCGISVWAPPVDENGNSVRALAFFERLTAQYNVHLLGRLPGMEKVSNKGDIRASGVQASEDQCLELLGAAYAADLPTVKELLASGTDVDVSDYDGRTALHAAASEGHLELVEFLLKYGANRDPEDRWRSTPLLDAQHGGHKEVVLLLLRYGAARRDASTAYGEACVDLDDALVREELPTSTTSQQA